MLFCPDCGSLLKPREDGKKTYLTCSCGYDKVEKEDILMKDEVKKSRKVEISKDETKKTMPKIKEECPKCHHETAYFWTQQTRASDEAETRFYECVKCSHRWRAYD
jgi:transcription factor S